jgi:hypothetical protein
MEIAMTEPKFTPGPWQTKHDYDREGRTTIIANVDGDTHADGSTTYSYDVIATCCDEFGEYLENAEANARLIRGAPRLYAALEGAEEFLSESGFIGSTLDEVRAALAEARGEQ